MAYNNANAAARRRLSNQQGGSGLDTSEPKPRQSFANANKPKLCAGWLRDKGATTAPLSQLSVHTHTHIRTCTHPHSHALPHTYTRGANEIDRNIIRMNVASKRVRGRVIWCRSRGSGGCREVVA